MRALLFCLATLMLLATNVTSAQADRTTVRVGKFGNPGTFRTYDRPARFQVNAEDSWVIFSKLRWRGWGNDRAVARGRSTTCARESCTTRPVRLTAGRLTDCGAGQRRYMKLTASRIPLYGPNAIDIPLDTSGCEAPLALAATNALPKLWPGAGGPFQLRPKVVDYANGHGLITGPGATASDPRPIRWVTWTHRRAVGTGLDWRNTCNPSCGEGTFVARKMRVTVRLPRNGHFTRMAIRFFDGDEPVITTLRHINGSYYWG